jgi:N-acetylglucosamine kinase-like BadF-type ATPase
VNAFAHVEEDTMAAVYATTAVSAVVCILGTGSNCCYFDGNSIIYKFPSLGDVVMDEGSGNYYGKALLNSYYYNQMPIELWLLFEKKYNLDEKQVLKTL